MAFAVILCIYGAIVAIGAIRIEMTKKGRAPTAAGLSKFLVAAVSLILVPIIGLVIEAIGVAIAIGSAMAAPFTVGGSLLLFLAVVVGVLLELVSMGLAIRKISAVMLCTVSGTISNARADELIASSYFFAFLGFIGIGAIGEIAEFSELGELADLEGLADIETPSIAEADSSGFGPADDTYGLPSETDGDPRTSHYVEGYQREDGTWVDGHWKSKRG